MEKILHICLNGSYTEGFNYQDNLITKYHSRLGYEVTLLAPQWGIDSEGRHIKITSTDYFNPDGVKVLRIPEYGKSREGAGKLKIYRKLYQIIERERADIIFLHNLQFLDTLTVTRYLKKHPGVICYVDNHADFSNSGMKFISHKILHDGLWRYCARRINPYVKKFYGVLPARVDWLVEEYKLPGEKCELLVMGADDELIERVSGDSARKDFRRKYGVKETDFLIMTGGKIDSFKRQTLLLMEAVQRIPGRDVRLIVFGSVEPDMMETMNSLCDGTRVQYIGWAKGSQSYEYFAAADLVVFPGRHSVYWEQAAGMGIPMLCRRWEGTTHVDVGGNVRFIEQDSVEAIQEMLEELLDNPGEYREMLEVARGAGRNKFSYREISRRALT